MFGIKGIEAVQFGSGILGVEPPVDTSSGSVAFRNQGPDFPLQRRFIGESLPEAGAGQHAELDLRHVQPTAVHPVKPGG